MRLVRFDNLNLPLTRGITVVRSGSSSNTQSSSRSREASIVLKDGETISLIIQCKKDGAYAGIKGNRVSFSIYYQAGVRYLLRFFDNQTGDNLGNSVSTVGAAAGALTSAGIAEKLNGTNAYKDDFEAKLINNITGAVYSDSTNITFSDSDPLTGGRGR